MEFVKTYILTWAFGLLALTILFVMLAFVSAFPMLGTLFIDSLVVIAPLSAVLLLNWAFGRR